MTMQPNWKASFVAGALVLGSVPGMGATSARAQAVDATPSSPYPGYYYSPGGYSGGVYVSPGYYPRTTGAGVGPRGSYYGSSPVVRRAQPTVNYYDWTTGRNNLAIPLAKPWLWPLR
jgi:hypothetical protein